MGEVKQGVHVWKQLVADVHCGFAGIDDRGPGVRFLRIGRESVVVTIEWEESRELHPSVAEFFIRIALEAAGVHAEHGNSEKREGEGLWDGEDHVHEEGGVVTTPVAGPFSGTGERRTANNKGSLTRDSGQEGLIGSIEYLVAE